MNPTGRTQPKFYDGQRLSYGGALCTVRYYGRLEFTSGDWLGVEWNDPKRGKHDGQHKGQRIFHCLSPSPTAASFIRPTRRPDPQRAFLEALRLKYGDTPKQPIARSKTQHAQSGTAIGISGKLVEEVGFEKVSQQQSMLACLRIAALDGLNVRGLLHSDDPELAALEAQKEVKEACPHIAEPDLGWNAIETMNDIIPSVNRWTSSTSFGQGKGFAEFVSALLIYLAV